MNNDSNFKRNFSAESIGIEIQPIDSTKPTKLESTFIKSKKLFVRSLLKKMISSKPEWFRNPSYKKNLFINNENIKFQNFYLQTEDGNLIGAHLFAPKKIDEDTKFVILIHGMSMNRYQFSKKFPVESFVESNVCVLIPDVRSFGDSEGEYDVEKINIDIQRCVSYLKHSYNANKVALIAHCLGCGIALEYYKFMQTNMVNKIVDKIVLISPYISEQQILKERLNFKLFSQMFNENIIADSCKNYNHDNLENILSVEKEKVVIFHGTKDLVNSFDHGLKLANEVGCKIYRSETDGYWSILGNREVIFLILEFLEEK